MTTYLTFSIGPVQPFIEAARTKQDLWTGSYVLSWLTAHAMKAAQNSGAKIISLTLTDNPLWELVSEQKKSEGRLLSSLPNLFTAEHSGGIDATRAAAHEAEQAVRKEWQEIANAVHVHLRKNGGLSDSKWNGWDMNWQKQVEDYWEIRTTVMDGAALPNDTNKTELPDEAWARGILAKLSAADKTIRTYPAPANEDEELEGFDARPKCVLMPRFAQMGRARFPGGDTEFWAALSQRFKPYEPKDRFCAIALIKRFAGKCHFAEKTSTRMEDMRPATTEEIMKRKWDGEGDPRYYAMLMLDGDHIGSAIKHADQKKLEQISGQMATFSSQIAANEIQRDEIQGELIYSGGDDLLAVLPLATALQGALNVNTTFTKLFAEVNKGQKEPITCSAGLVIAHYKEDMRLVLQAARKAEKRAKDGGRDRLAITVMRRSGEETTIVVAWKQVHFIQTMVKEFRDGKSDRWAYQLRQIAEMLGLGAASASLESSGQLKPQATDQIAFIDQLMNLELKRVINRGDKRLDAKTANDYWSAENGQIAMDKILTYQTASFIARGREAR